jgi:hypothetical protein
MRPRVRPRLVALLVGSACLALIAWWWESQAAPSAEPPAFDAFAGAGHAQAGKPPGAPVALPLPARWPLLVLSSSGKDPFTGMSPSVQPPLPVPEGANAVVLPAFAPGAATAQVPAPEPVTPVAPPVSYRFVGTFVGPGALPRVYVASGDANHEIGPGTLLPDGYVVESIGPQAIRLRHPLLDGLAEIPVPPAAEAGR